MIHTRKSLRSQSHPMRTAIAIGAEEFRTKKDASERVRNVVAQFPLNEPIFGPHDFLDALLNRHPAAIEKMGPGRAGYEVRLNKSGHPEIYIHRTDGSVMDFSWHRCLIGKPADPLKDLRGAMRDAVREQIVSYRDEELRVDSVCGVCALPLQTRKDVHVDHIEPFDTLVKTFIGTIHGELPSTFGVCATNGPSFLPQDSEFAETWKTFHARHASLRLSHVRCNLTRQRGRRDA